MNFIGHKEFLVKAIVAACIALLAPSMAFASGDEAWTDLDKAARAACTAEIKKDRNIVTVSATGYSEGIGGKDGDQYYVLTLDGKAKAYTSKVVCLFDKVSKKAQITEITAP
jgi:hypothetical protein